MLYALLFTIAAQAAHVQGHRGARAVFPENTLPSLLYALNSGAEAVEFDVVATKDDVLVVTHDFVVNPQICLGADGKPVPKGLRIRDLTLAEVRALDCGTLRHPKFPHQRTLPGTRIPTLKEVLLLIDAYNAENGRRAAANIEIKSSPKYPDANATPQRLAELTLETLRDSRYESPWTAQSFDYRVVKALRAAAPHAILGALTQRPSENIVRTARELGVDYMAPVWWKARPGSVRALRRMGVDVVVWTANTPRQWNWARRAGVSGIITDDPAGCIAHLKARGE